jgi:predicted transposase/invertase (TIGR01784 family)
MHKKSRRSNQDAAWKDILDAYFKEFMVFFYCDIAEKINWAAGYESLDKELQAITTDAMIGKRFVDKLFKVKTLEGQEERILIHIEVQGKKEEKFPKRLFHYYCKLFTKRDQSILTLAILTDDNSQWHPKRYQKEVFGFPVLNFNFKTSKLLDYKNKKQVLSRSSNPFAVVVLAHLALIETKKDPAARCQMKFSLVRSLYEKGYNRDYVINLLKVIDWALILPEDLELEYQSKVHQLEEEKNMAYVTSFERRAEQRGEQLKALAIAKKMHGKGVDIKFIQEMTDLSDQELLQVENGAEALLSPVT